jgi:hypothetical protein
MNNNTRRFVAIVGIGLALMIPMNKVFADSENKEFKDFESFQKLSAEWWQWALSIPASVNPQLDKTGEDAVVGQRGSVWFLAGVFNGGTVVRNMVFVPEGAALFFPVINSVNINTPGVCGQEGSFTVNELRASSAAFIDGAVNLSVTVDGIAIRKLRRVQSRVFGVALPKDNVYVALCSPLPVPPGIYSPAVDDGFYVLLDPLRVGNHTLHFHAENPSQNPVFTQDVTYNLTVVPVLLK